MAAVLGRQIRNDKSRRDGRPLPPNVTRVVFDLVFLQKHHKFGLEILLAVMFDLTAYITDSSIYLGNPDRERAITFLPFKAFPMVLLMHPF